MSEENTQVAGKATAFGTLVNVITSPSKAMKDIEDHNKWMWLPILFTLGISMVYVTLYYNIVDIDWFIDQIIASSAQEGQEMPEEARAFMNAGVMTAGSLVGIAIFFFVSNLAYSVYLLLVDKFTSDRGHSFGDWFAVSVWASVPTAIGAIASIVYIMMAGSNQITMDQANFYSLNALVTQYPMSHPAAGWAGALHPFMIWMMVVAGFGVAAKTGSSVGKGITIAAAPWVIVFALWGFAVTGG